MQDGWGSYYKAEQGLSMAVSKLGEATQREWHKALLSVYYHGRREQPQLARRRPPRRLPSLEQAVNTLVGSMHPEVMGPVRLALADLCRTRARSRDPVVVSQMRRVAQKFGALLANLSNKTEEHGLHLVSAATFEDIFISSEGLDPEGAYLQAIAKMIDLHASLQGKPRGATSQRKLDNYRVGQ